MAVIKSRGKSSVDKSVDVTVAVKRSKVFAYNSDDKSNKLQATDSDALRSLSLSLCMVSLLADPNLHYATPGILCVGSFFFFSLFPRDLSIALYRAEERDSNCFIHRTIRAE